MKDIHSGLKAAKFTKPKDIVNATICTVSGLVATDACKKDTRKVVKSEIFASGKVPTDTCDVHKIVEVCSVSKKLPTDFCHMYKDLTEISVITRSSKTKTSDSKYLMPTKTCTVHTKEPVVEPEVPVTPETPEVPSTQPEVNPGTGTETETETPGTENPGTGTDTPSTDTTTPATPGENTGVGGLIYGVIDKIVN